MTTTISRPWARDKGGALVRSPVQSRNTRADVAGGALLGSASPAMSGKAKSAYPVSDPFGTPVTKVGLQ